MTGGSARIPSDADEHEMSGERDLEIEQHERERRRRERDDREHDGDRDDLPRVERLAAAVEHEDRVDRVVLELAVERARRDERRREEDRDPVQRARDTRLARLTRSERETLHQHEQTGEGERRDEAVGVPAFGGELARRDEQRAVESVHISRSAPSSMT